MTPTTLVIPTVGRPSLHALLRSLAAADGPDPIEVIVVDDRPGDPPPLEVEAPLPVRLLRSGGSGPAGARNVGWRAATTPWVSFVDDDVLLDPDWLALLADDLATDEDVVAVQGRVTVPLPTDRAPPATGSVRPRASSTRRGSPPTYRCAGRHWIGSADSTSASPGPTARIPTSDSVSPSSGR